MSARPDVTFHASPRLAMEAPAETLAYTLMLSPDGSAPDGLAVLDEESHLSLTHRGSSTRQRHPHVTGTLLGCRSRSRPEEA